jgi:WhiB family redox-sensing transcriptional regulator
MDWRDRAACLDQSPELFFPVGFTGAANQQLEQAKRVCGGCDVRETCLRWALELGLDHGVWGGASEDERRSIKRRAARARALNRGKAKLSAVPSLPQQQARASSSHQNDGSAA